MNVPSQTLYVGNLNHKTKKHGARRQAPSFHRPQRGLTQAAWTRV